MVTFTADPTEFNSANSVFAEFFTDIDNLHLIMPAEVDQWTADKDRCSFVIKNLGKMSMEKGIVNPNSEFEFISTADSKVDFTLVFRLKAKDQATTSGYFELQTDVNPLVEMMVKRPLTNFVNLLTQNLKSKLT